MKKSLPNPVSEDETKDVSTAGITKVDDSKNIKPASASYDVKASGEGGTPLKTEKVASVIAPDQVFGGQKSMGFNAAGFGSSGTGEGFLADFPKTPASSKTRGSSRFDKKVEKVANQINFTPSEQFKIDYRESKPLALASDEDVGYNGTYRTDVFRLQKKSGASPAELDYQRSVDFIMRDMIYYADGQTIVPDRKVQGIYPTIQVSEDDYGDPVYPIVPNFALNRSNVILDSIDFRVNPAGLDYVIFNETDLPVNPQDDANFDASSQAYTYAVNRAELEREQIDNAAGDESKEGWSPLARAIEQPSQVLAMLHDMEYITGTELFLAEKKMESAFAFQLNRAIKDGQNLVQPGVESLTRLVDEWSVGSSYAANLHSVFDQSMLRAGAASLIIPIYDSTQKYNTKADILLQPRGPRMHLNTLRNSNKSFRVNPLFVQAYTARECFATIDHDYDASKPIMMTDRAVAVHPMSLAQFGDWGTNRIHVLANDDNMDITNTLNSYVPILPGGHVYHIYAKRINAAESEGTDLFVSFDSDHDLDILELGFGILNDSKEGDAVEMIVSMNALGLDGYVHAVSTGLPLAIGTPTHCIVTTAKGFLRQGSYRYGYSDQRNHYTREVNIPLVSGIRAYLEAYAGKIFNVLKTNSNDVIPHNVNVIATHSTSCFSFYDFLLAVSSDFMVNDRKQYFRDVADYSEMHGYPFTHTVTVGDAVKVSYKNMMCSGMDEPLKTVVADTGLSATWKFPELFAKLKVANTTTMALCPWYTNEYSYKVASNKAVRDIDAWNISWPSIRAGNYLAGFDQLYELGEKGARLNFDIITDVTHGLDQTGVPFVYKHGLATDGQIILQLLNTSACITGADLLQMPRELGWSQVSPAGVLSGLQGPGSHDYSVDQVGNSCYRTIVYHNILAAAEPVGNVQSSINTTRAANYVQDYAIIFARETDAVQQHFFGISLGAGDCYDADLEPIDGRSSFGVLVSKDGAKVVAAAQANLVSDHTSLYYRVNVLPFVINPYDSQVFASGEPIIVDIYELPYAFGLCGFRASDFSLEVFNHLNEADNLGRLLIANSRIAMSYLK